MGKVLGNTHSIINRTRKEFGQINSARRIPIGIGDHLTEIFVRQGGSVVVAGGASNGTAKGENPGGLINSFEINASSRGVYPGGQLKKLEPRSIIRRRILERGFAIVDSALTGAAGTFTLDQPYILRFAQPRAPRPFDFALPTDQYQSIELVINVGGRDSQFTGNDRTFDFSGAFFDVIDRREKVLDSTPKHVIVESDDILPIAAANSRLPYNDFPVGENVMDILMMAESTAARTLVDTVLNNVKLKYGTDFVDLTSNDIKHAQREYVADVGQSMVGLFYLPFNPDLLSYGGIPLKEAGDLKAELNVSNPGGANLDQLLIHTRRVLWPEDYLGSR